ncbi:MAG: Lrp/AsnC family transcriptional regulator [Saprospiraceae bacterium]
MKEKQLDPFDVRILNELTADARIPLVKLAKKLKVSNTLIHQRVKKLKERGLLLNATYLLDPWTLGYQTSAYTQIMLTDSKHHRKVEEKLRKIPEIVECVNISGRYALIIRIYARNNRHLRDIIYEKIHTINEVEGTNSTISFETAFRRNVPLRVDLGEEYD